jgi:putative RecB family exonuclease
MAVYSHSRLAAYETCPMQYRLRYIDLVDVERRETVESFLGRRVHETLQYLYDRLAEGALLTEQELLTHLGDAWEREWHDQVQLVRADAKVADYRSTAERCVANYYRANHPFDQGRTVATEMAVVFPLDGERDVQIKGYIDRLVRLAPGFYEIHDYKTSRRLPTQAEIDRDRQLALYQMAVNRMMPDVRQVRLVWHYLAHGRRLRSLRTPEALEQLRCATLALIDRVEDAGRRDDFPAVRSRLCGWCDYRPVCPAWNPVQGRLAFPGLDAGGGAGVKDAGAAGGGEGGGSGADGGPGPGAAAGSVLTPPGAPD